MVTSGDKWEKVRKVVGKWGKVAISVICLEFFTKWPLAAILDDRKSLSIAFLAISDQYATFFFFSKWPPAAILDPDFCQNR